SCGSGSATRCAVRGSAATTATASPLAALSRGKVHIDTSGRLSEVAHHHHSDALALQEVHNVHQARGLETCTASRIRHAFNATAPDKLVEECALLRIEAFIDLWQVVLRNRQRNECRAQPFKGIHQLLRVRVDVWTVQSGNADAYFLQVVA